jgi:hypothetical protein
MVFAANAILTIANITINAIIAFLSFFFLVNLLAF